MGLNVKLMRSIPLILAIGLLLTIVACERDLPMTAEQPVASSANQVTILKVKDDPVSGLEKLFVVERLIDDDGGLIRIGDYDSGYSGLKFPEDAINEDQYPDGVLIQFYWESESMLQADFYPEGLTFDEPVTLRLSYKDADLTGVIEEDLGIYYYNPSTDNWELISNQVNTNAKYVEGHINHFSRYAIGME